MNNLISPFTFNQHEYLLKTFNCWFNVAEGGKRGGKNVLNTLAFAVALENHPDKIHLAGATTIGNAKMNILDCNGFGLMNYYAGRCREGKYKNKDCLYINTVVGDKIIIVSGGGKSGDNVAIKGNTYGMVYITEANECNPDYLMECFDRTIASSDRKIFHDLNPKSGKHWYYTDVLGFHEEQSLSNADYGYNYGHFTIVDNLSMTEEQVNTVLSTYDKNTVWYQRDILGLRKQADGAIYPMFTANEKAYIIELEETYYRGYFDKILIGIDWGDSGSFHSFTAGGITRGFKSLIVLKTERHNAKDLTPKDLENLVVSFVQNITKKYGNVDMIFCDHINTYVNGCRQAFRSANIDVGIVFASKGKILDRILTTIKLMVTNRIKITNDCSSLVDAFNGATWSFKYPDERLDDGTSDIDSLDSFEYMWCFYIGMFFVD